MLVVTGGNRGSLSVSIAVWCQSPAFVNMTDGQVRHDLPGSRLIEHAHFFSSPAYGGVGTKLEASNLLMYNIGSLFSLRVLERCSNR
jgi:hypothetical protein